MVPLSKYRIVIMAICALGAAYNIYYIVKSRSSSNQRDAMKPQFKDALKNMPTPSGLGAASSDNVPATQQQIDTIQGILATGNVRERVSALEALAHMQGPELLRPILTATTDPDAEVRAKGIEALAVRKGPEAQAAALRALADTDVNVRAQGALTLAALNDSASLKPLLRQLQISEDDYEISMLFVSLNTFASEAIPELKRMRCAARCAWDSRADRSSPGYRRTAGCGLHHRPRWRAARRPDHGSRRWPDAWRRHRCHHGRPHGRCRPGPARRAGGRGCRGRRRRPGPCPLGGSAGARSAAAPWPRCRWRPAAQAASSPAHRLNSASLRR